MAAIQNANSLWSMFFFGFGGIFVIIQMHGLNLQGRVKRALLALYISGAVFIYSGRGVSHLWEPFTIPLIDYPGVIVLALQFGLVVRASALWRRERVAASR
jgi:hypothetical protein